MKSLTIALLLSALAAPVLALPVLDGTLLAPQGQETGRRSGACPHRPEGPVLTGQSVARERSTNTCGGV